MILDVEYNKKKSTQSEYKPTEEAKEAIKLILKDFQIGNTVMNNTYREFDDMSLIERQALDQMSFNIYQEDNESSDPDQAWRSNAVRPIVRNKCISIAAHITRQILYPIIFAQNENDEEDKEAARVMRVLLEWRNEQADYDKTFLYSVIGALVNPAIILHTEFSEVKRKMKEIMENGKWEVKEIIDDVLSGFMDSIVDVSQLYIGNIKQPDIQKQPFLIWRKVISYDTAYNKYASKYSNFKYVSPGVQTIYVDQEDTFYEQYDETLRGELVEEIIYYNRTEDLHLIVVNGVLLTEADQPITRLDKKYPFTKTGYEPISEGNFFYYKSLASKLSKDEQIVNTLYRMMIDGTYMNLMPSLAVYGDEEVDSSIAIPGSINSFGENTKVEPIKTGSNFQQGFMMLGKVESGMAESSTDSLQQGVAGGGRQTAYEISRLETNARTMFDMFGKMIGFLVKDFGELCMSDILQYMTIPDASKILGGKGTMELRSFIIGSEKGTNRIEFRGETEMPDVGELDKIQMEEAGLPEDVISMEQELATENASYDLLKAEGGMKSKNRHYIVNAKEFRELKFKAKIIPSTVNPLSDEARKVMNLDLYDRAIKNPLADQEKIFKDFLLGSYEISRNNPDDYIKKDAPQPMPQNMSSNQAPSQIKGAVM